MGLGQQIINGCTQKQNAPLAYRISLYHALQIMNTSLRVTSYVCTFISRQLGESYRVLEGLAFYEIEVRLARTLIRLALSSEELIVSATHAELAAIIGTRQEEVTKMLGHFRALGLVASAPHRRGLRVLDLERLRSDLPECNPCSAISVVQQWNASLEACF